MILYSSMLPLLDKTIKFPPSSLPFNPSHPTCASDKTEALHYTNPIVAHDLLQQEDTEQFRSSGYIGWRRLALAHEFLPFVYYTLTRLLDHSYGKKEKKKTVPGLQPPRSKTRNSATQEVTSGRQSIQILSLMGILSGRGRNSANPGGSHASPPHHMPNHSIHTNAGGARYDPKHPYTRPSVGGVVSDVLTRTFHPPPHLSPTCTLEHGSEPDVCIHGHMNIVRSFRTSQSAPILLYPPLRSPIPPIPRVSYRYMYIYDVNQEKLKKKKKTIIRESVKHALKTEGRREPTNQSTSRGTDPLCDSVQGRGGGGDAVSHRRRDRRGRVDFA